MPSPRSPLLSAPATRRKRRRTIRLAPLALCAAAAFLGGLIAGARHESDGPKVAKAFVAAWAREDYPAMHALLAPDARRRASLKRLVRTYDGAARTMTLEQLIPGKKVRELSDTLVEVPVTFKTKLFGTLSGRLRIPLAGADDDVGIDWRSSLVFPGLPPGGKLERRTTLPPRGALLARNGAVLAQGPDRVNEAGPVTANIVGTIGPIPPERAAEFAARGIPADAEVGLSGLEREFDVQLTGTPGGVLAAGGRTIATALPRRGTAVRTSIDPRVQAAATDALAGRYGGVAVIEPKTGEILGLAGLAATAPQPPGSTFKIVTLAGVLDAGVAKATSTYPFQTSTTLSGVELQNANGESCGGSLQASFATSCNSVFAPLGAKLGAKRLVATAERFGFNGDPPFAGAARSTLPPPEEIGDDLAVGSSAIGQGKVQATALQMASVAATIATRGVRHPPSLRRGGAGTTTRVVSARSARTILRFMRAVVQGGTGKAAAIPGVNVAGKTGTAELRTTVRDPNATPTPGAAIEDDTTDTDAWFTAFAPTGKPRVAVAVLLVSAGAGGDTAAPAAREVLLSALKR